MFNVQNQQINDSGKNVRSLLSSIEQDIEYLSSLGNWLGNEPWLANIIEELNKQYRELRKDIKENANSWSYSQYCERLAYHYYNLACYCNDELFDKYKVDLEIIKKYLERCLEKLNELSQEDCSDETKELKDDAKRFLTEVNKIYKQQNDLLIKYSSSNVARYIKQCIILGNFNQISLQQCSDENRRQIQNIQLLSFINMLEDGITVPEYKDASITIKQSYLLGKAYELADQSALGKRYERTSSKIAEEYSDNNQKVKDIVSREIARYKSDLAKVKNYIREKFYELPDTKDNAYIDEEYIKCCKKFWLEEATDELKKIINKKDRNTIREVFSSIDNIKNLDSVPDCFRKLQYYKLLMEHHKLVNEEDEKALISQFKEECLEQIVAYSDAAKNELVFLKALIAFLSTSEYLQFIIVKLKLENFCLGNLSFGEFLKSIVNLKLSTNSENLTVLQEAAKCLQQEEDLFLIDQFKKVIGGYIKQVNIQERKIDGRLVIEVIRRSIVVSEILQKLENKLSINPNIEEVRFISADIIHIDAGFKDKVWKGKNIAILTKTIKIYGEVTWDVSGKDSNHTYPDNAGTGKDDHGRQGKDGYSGESGGNVVILAEKIENPEKFTIISNGGKGSKGQDGGNGRDGDDGKGITKAELEEKFPPPAKTLAASREFKVLTILESIKKDLSSIKSEWYQNGRNKIFNEKVIEEVIKYSEELEEFRRMLTNEDCPDFEVNIFINAVTKQGNEINFSFEYGKGFTWCQSFFLYKGSIGQPGGDGGERGLGGQGGYPGDITISHTGNSSQEFSIKRDFKKGEDGKEGEGGFYGKHGKNGWDMGYMDCSMWHKPKIVDGECVLKYHDNRQSDRVWCPYKERYAEITGRPIEDKRQKEYEKRRNTINTRQNNDRKHHARAVKKKKHFTE